VTVNSVVADMLYDEELSGVEELEKEFRKKIVIKADPNLHQEQYEVVMVQRLKPQKQMPVSEKRTGFFIP